MTHTNLKNELQVWRKVHEVASSILHDLKGFSVPPPIPPSIHSIDIPCLDLPFPDDIIAPIHSLNIAERIRREILRCLTRRVKEWQNKYTETYIRTCSTMSWSGSSPSQIHALRQAYQSLYKRQCIPVIQSHVSSILKEVGKRQLDMQQTNRKRSFNTQYTPLLEKYFEYNAYPTAHERSLLARRTTMTTRQIEVWFQNHRNRAKVGKQCLRKLSMNAAPFKFLDEQQATVSKKESSPPSDTDEASDDDGNEVASSPCTGSPTPLSCQITERRPPHAFPATYPSKCREDAFSNGDGRFQLPSPVWQRRPATAQISYSSISVDELASLFASHLTIRDQNFLKGRRKDPVRPWFSSRVTIPHPAPHPALIRTPKAPSHQTAKRCRPFNPSKPPAGTWPWGCEHRQTPTLPKRSPINMATKFDKFAAPPTSLHSNGSSSRSVSESSVSSVLETPPTSPISLPSIVQFGEEDLDFLEQLFGTNSDFHPIDSGFQIDPSGQNCFTKERWFPTLNLPPLPLLGNL